MLHDDPHEYDYAEPPAHYAGSITPWEYVKAQKLDYWTGNVLKYITRAGRKAGSTRLHDLTKARNFLNFAIKDERAALAKTAADAVKAAPPIPAPAEEKPTPGEALRDAALKDAAKYFASAFGKYAPVKDYSFTVVVPIYLPEGCLSRLDQAEMQRVAAGAAEDAAKSFIRRIPRKGLTPREH